MKLNKKNLELMMNGETSELKKEVYQIALDHIDGYDKQEGWFKDLLQHGCISGMVSSLVYYNDTIAFFERHKDEIFDLASEQAEQMGSNNVLEFLSGLNGAQNVGDYDQFANLMSWYAFEETARNIYEQDFELVF